MAPPMDTHFGDRPPGSGSTGELSFAEIAAWMRKHMFGLAVGALLGLVLGLLLCALMPRIYRSQALLAPNSETMQSSGLGALAGQFGGIASLAGIRLPSGSNKDEAIELLKSRGFAARFISANNLMPRLYENDWDAAGERWSVAEDEVPTVNQGVDRFVRRLRRVQEDRGTGMVTVTVDWTDREESARWVREMVNQVNEELRSRAVDDAERNLAFLESQVEKTSVIPVREAMYKLVEDQMKTIMLANVRTDYAFRVIDPPVVADEDDYISPNWALIGFLGAFFGAACGVFASIAYQLRRSRRRASA